MSQQALKEELEKLAARNGGMLQPKAVVMEAENEDSPLHFYFEWDDSEAARAYREEQARSLIRSVKIEIQSSQPVTIRAFVSLPVDRENGAGYRQIQDVINNEFLRRQLAEEIRQKIIQWQKKAEIYGIACDFSPMQSVAGNLDAA